MRRAVRRSVRGNNSGANFPSARAIAQMLTAPTRKHRLFVIGDSRHTQKQARFLTSCPEIAWSGAVEQYWNALDAAGAHDSTGNANGTDGAACTSPWIDAVNGAPWFPFGGIETQFLGGAEPSSGDNNIIMRLAATATTSKANYPLLWAVGEAGGRVGRVRVPYYRHTGAMAANPGVRISYRSSGTTFGAAGNRQSSYVYDMTGTGYGMLDCSIPDTHDWATYAAPAIEITATPGGSTVLNQTLAIGPPSLEFDGPGIVYYPIAKGGWSVDGWLNTTGTPLSTWSSWVPTVVADDDGTPIFWLDLGTNNPSSNTQVQHVTKMTTLIGRIRAVYPRAPILLTSAFASSTSGSNPYWRAAAADLAATIPGILYLDTYGAMPDYSTGSALGYYGDTVHYNATGDAALAATIGDMIAVAAADPDSVSSILGSTLHTWLRADSTTTNGSGRFRWTDLSGNGRHADSPSAGADPVAGTDVALNSRAVVTFDGSTDYLASIAASSQYTALHDGVARATVWVVNKPTAHSYAIPFGTSTGPTTIGLIAGMVVTAIARSGVVANTSGTYVFDTTANGLPSLAASIVETDHRSTALSTKVVTASATATNTDSTIAGSRSASAPFGTLHVGSTATGANKFSGNIAEVIVAIGCSDAQRDAITDLLKRYYALPG